MIWTRRKVCEIAVHEDLSLPSVESCSEAGSHARSARA